jgi:hypothetical protein
MASGKNRGLDDEIDNLEDKELVSALVSHLLFNKLENDTPSLCTLLTEIIKKLKPEEHADAIDVSSFLTPLLSSLFL